MADGQFGGNRSVHWLVRPDDFDVPITLDATQGAIGHAGIDRHGNETPGDFTVRIRVPTDEGRRQAFIASLKAAADAAQKARGDEIVSFNLAIEQRDNAETQIQVAWGEQKWEDTLKATDALVRTQWERRRATGGGIQRA